MRVRRWHDHPGQLVGDGSSSSAESRSAEGPTQPKMPPCAAIIRSPTSWNSGKYEPTQSESTRHSKPRSLASRTVVCTHTSVVTPADDQAVDPVVAQDQLEVGRVEGALAGLVEDHLAGRGRERVDDVVARLAADEDAALRPRGCRCRARAAAGELGRRAVAEVGPVALARVDDEHARRPGRGEHGLRPARRPARAATTSLPSSSPKPPGSRKSRWRSMITSAVVAGASVNGYGSAGTSNAVVYNGVDIGLGMGRRYSRRPAVTLALMSRLHAGFWTPGPAAASLARA